MTQVPPRPVIRLQEVHRTYFSAAPPIAALKRCSLSVHYGDYVAILGPSGSGKSTLLNVLGLLDNASDGTYLLGDLNVNLLRDPERAGLRSHYLGFVFQTCHLFPHRTAIENVEQSMLYAATPLSERGERARAALARVGLEHRMRALPRTLSGGERQRVAIARALVIRPTVLLCDEPTSYLDSATATAVLDLFDALNVEGLTVVVAQQDHLTTRARRLIRIRDGELTEAPPGSGGHQAPGTAVT